MSINTIKTGFLMMFLSSLLVIAAYFIGGPNNWQISIIIALVFSIGMNFFAYWYSDRIALKMSGAREISEGEYKELHWIVEEQARLSGMPKPRVYIIENDSPNAFATGRNPHNAAVAATTGIIRLLNKQELASVMAHEMAHVGNRDTLIMTMAASIAGAIMAIAFIARFAMFFGGMNRGRQSGGSGLIPIIGLVVVAIVLPIAAVLVRLAISRAREYQADASGARLTKNPLILADALEKLESVSKRKPMKVNEAVSHLFIVNPLSGKSMSRLFSSHPPMSERVKRLRKMSSLQITNGTLYR
jgi:heat shock protein HtpX